MAIDYKLRISEIDSLIRQGQLPEARLALKKTKFNLVPRDLLADFANLTRRTQQPTQALRILQPILRPAKKLHSPPTPRERASYAASLAALGALQEARSVLAPVLSDMTPEVQLYGGFLNIYDWNYAQAVPYFETYLELPGPSTYQKIVARLNLAACLNFTGALDEEMLTDLIRESRGNEWNLIAFEALLLSVQLFIRRKDFASAESRLASAQTLASEKGLDPFFVQKWRLLCRIESSGPNFELWRELARIREASVTGRHWETTRECDFYSSLHLQKSELFSRVYFGTTYESYRQRMREQSKEWYTPPDAYILKFGGRNGTEIDLSLGSLGTVELKTSDLNVRLLRAFTSDFYKPLRMGSLFSLLYPDQFFDPESSPSRVRTALSRARIAFAENEIPLKIECKNEQYSISSLGSCEIKIRLDYSETDRPAISQPVLEVIKSHWPFRAFSAKQAAEALNLPHAKALKLLVLATDSGSIIRIGTGRATLFRAA